MGLVPKLTAYRTSVGGAPTVPTPVRYCGVNGTLFVRIGHTTVT